jgi:MYXO-CTERM domain-containing protein
VIADAAGGAMPFQTASAIQSPAAAPGEIAEGGDASVAFVVEVDAGTAPGELIITALVDPDGGGPAPADEVPLGLTITEPPAECGDGRIDDGEECDDGDPDPGDGCSGECTVEDGFICSSEPSNCVPVAADSDADADADANPDGDVAPDEDADVFDASGDTEHDAGPDAGIPPVEGDGCGCAAAGSDPSGTSALALSFVLGVFVFLSRARRRVGTSEARSVRRRPARNGPARTRPIGIVDVSESSGQPAQGPPGPRRP